MYFIVYLVSSAYQLLDRFPSLSDFLFRVKGLVKSVSVGSSNYSISAIMPRYCYVIYSYCSHLREWERLPCLYMSHQLAWIAIQNAQDVLNARHGEVIFIIKKSIAFKVFC